MRQEEAQPISATKPALFLHVKIFIVSLKFSVVYISIL